MVTDQIMYAFTWASWSSIIAGVVAAVALWILFAILGVALGFSVIKPKADDPASGLGIAFGVWSAVTVVISMAVGGFIAGLFAGQRGLEHGMLVWAVATIIGACYTMCTMRSAMRGIGSAVKSVGSGAAGVMSSLGKGAAHAASGMAHTASDAVSSLKESVDLHFDQEDINKLGDNITSVLEDTGIETLQPDYLKQQMREARADLRGAVHQLTMHPGDYEQIITKFLQSVSTRLDSLTKDVDKGTAVNALIQARGISHEEAVTMVDDAMRAYNQALQKSRDVLSEAKLQVQEAKVYMKDMADQAKEKADKLASHAAKIALCAGIALIVAAGICMVAGLCGTEYSINWYAVQSTYQMR